MSYYKMKQKAFKTVKDQYFKGSKIQHIKLLIAENYGLSPKFVEKSIEIIQNAETA